jgi:branched-chain amino acid transport system substrate-binding protein
VRYGPALAIAASLLAVACADDPVVGVLCPASGPAEAYGRSVNDGVRLALDAATDQQLLPPGFQAVAADTRSSPRRAVAGYRRMVDEGRVRMVIGGITSREAEALIPVVETKRVICLSPSAPATNLASQSRYFYRIYSTDEVEGFTAARFLRKEADVRSVLVYTDGSLFTRGIEAEFRQHFGLILGGKIPVTVHVGDEGWERHSIDSIHAFNPDAVYIVGHADNIVATLRHLREIGFAGLRCTTSSVYLADVMGTADGALDGVVFPIAPMDLESIRDPLFDFVRRFRAAYGHDPDIYAAHGFDAMRVAIRAMLEARGLRPADLHRFISLELGAFEGVTGSISFDEHGDAARYPVMHIVWEGHVVPVDRLRSLRLEVLQDALDGILEPSPARSGRPTAGAPGRPVQL